MMSVDQSSESEEEDELHYDMEEDVPRFVPHLHNFNTILHEFSLYIIFYPTSSHIFFPRVL